MRKGLTALIFIFITSNFLFSAFRLQAQERAPTEAEIKSGQVHLETKPGRTYVLIGETEFSSPFPNPESLTVSRYYPPNFPIQKTVQAGFKITAGGQMYDSIPIKVYRFLEPFALYQKLQEKAGLGDRIHVTTRYTAEIHIVKLLAGAPSNNIPDMPLNFRQSLTDVSYGSANLQKFRHWQATNGLIRAATESDLAFAFRVYQFMQMHFKYVNIGKDCWGIAKTGEGECGGLSDFAVAVLRANGIPAYRYRGFWVKDSYAPEPAESHVRLLFFARGVGWVPVDASGALQWGENNLAAFGNSSDNYFTLTVLQDVLTDPRMQYVMYEARGETPRGPDENTITQTWKGALVSTADPMENP